MVNDNKWLKKEKIYYFSKQPATATPKNKNWLIQNLLFLASQEPP